MLTDRAPQARAALGLNTRNLPVRLRHYLASPAFQDAVLSWPSEVFEGMRSAPVDGDEAEFVAEKAAGGDDHAKLMLVARFLRYAESAAWRLGENGAADKDDVLQEVFASVLSEASRPPGDRPFLDRAFSAAKTALSERIRVLHFSTGIPRMQVTRYLRAMDKAGNDLAAAWEWLSGTPDGRHMTFETFEAIHRVMIGALEYREWSTDDLPRDSLYGTESYAQVEDREAVSQALAILDPRSREAVERHYGLAGYAPQTQEDIALALGCGATTVHRILSAARATLADLLGAS